MTFLKSCIGQRRRKKIFEAGPPLFSRSPQILEGQTSSVFAWACFRASLLGVSFGLV